MDAIERLLGATTLEGQPAAFYAELRRVLEANPGFVFATLFVVHEGETLRVFTTEETKYPIGVRKPMMRTEWGERVIRGRSSYLAATVADLRWAFPDHETIVGLGCGSAITVLVVHDGRALGSINLNHRERYYTPDHVAFVERLAPTLIPALLQAVAAVR